MFQIIGVVVVFVMVFGGFMLAGGHFDVILKAAPFEMMMIGGAAVGAFLIGNSFKTVMAAMGGFGKIMVRPAGVAQEHRQAGIMRLQGFLQVHGVVRVENRDGAHVRSCQKPAQS